MEISFRALHERAKRVGENFRRSEIEVLRVLNEVEEEAVWQHMGCSSLFNYAVKEMRLSPASAYNFIAVARKGREIPALQAAIERDELSVSAARKITPVITIENNQEWITLAKTVPKVELEREVARVNPKAITPDRAKWVSGDRMELKVGVSEKLFTKFRRAQNLVCQRIQAPADFEATLEEVVDSYIDRFDPVEKAKRVEGKRRLEERPPGEPVPGQANLPQVPAAKNQRYMPAELRHKVFLRDRGRCTFTDEEGLRCGSERWIEIHHLRPLAEGGLHSAENLTTLCAAHHKWEHGPS